MKSLSPWPTRVQEFTLLTNQRVRNDRFPSLISLLADFPRVHRKIITLLEVENICNAIFLVFQPDAGLIRTILLTNNNPGIYLPNQKESINVSVWPITIQDYPFWPMRMQENNLMTNQRLGNVNLYPCLQISQGLTQGLVHYREEGFFLPIFLLPPRFLWIVEIVKSFFFSWRRNNDKSFRWCVSERTLYTFYYTISTF